MRVPPEQFAAAQKRLTRQAGRELERYMIFHALREAYEHSIQISSVDTGKARFGLNPTARRPVALGHADRPAFPAPGAERLLPLIPKFGGGVHGYLTFHATDSRGVYDYAGNDAGRSLENGWSPQARDGVIGPTKRYVEARAGAIARDSVRDASKALQRKAGR